MRHSKSLEEVDYKELIKAFSEDFSLIDDKHSRWIDMKDCEPDSPYHPSSVGDEMNSETQNSPNKSGESQIKYSRTPSNLDEM